MHKTSLIAGTLLGASAVIIGAFGAHALKKILSPELLASFEVGVRYQFYHALALLFLGVLAPHLSSSVQPIWMSWLFGTILFSGSIYILCILKSTLQIGLGGLGLITPLGGLLMIIGWLWLAYKIWITKSTL